jgi:hypothetical protein
MEKGCYYFAGKSSFYFGENAQSEIHAKIA